MSKTFSVNQKVQWNWGDGTASGYIRRVYKDKITKTLKGTEVTRNADSQNPAYLIEQQDGGKVLKSHSEISKSP